MNLLRPDYDEQSKLVSTIVEIMQPRNGTDYSTDRHRRVRERIAVNVHHGLPPLEGVH